MCADVPYFCRPVHILVSTKGYNYMWKWVFKRLIIVHVQDKAQFQKLLWTNNNCDRDWENRSYLHKVHLFVLRHISPVLYVLSKLCSNEFLTDFCIYDDILGTIRITDKKLLHFKLSKAGHNLCVDKTGFPRPGHILMQ